jgi:hypothetical protein
MRKLAREAVIFMLLASLLAFAGWFVFMDSTPSIFVRGEVALLYAWIGFPIGLGLWGLYRLIRFAVNG